MKPTDSELEVLALIWQQGALTVRQIHDQIKRTRNIGYTTTLKIMQIMHDKNILQRDTQFKTHIYNTLVSQEDAQVQLLDKLLKSVFSGSAKNLVMKTLGNHKSSPEELEEIKRMIEKLEGGKDD